ncbi:hypothetical protein A9P82_11810 [Arachidicoccus ginsenosidimutans]|uniref:PepSY-associated TM helix domain-containing protein n=1 Tax=Arachidicoccus sp. BS20 TaxID=1850526 RepID=UPI0007F10AB5|nr:PepSY-associated TM helix domain-containing protein [Arachidicoccus sp. BS20]ANI89911.1 hypothetical protein A9P82_11810 [Arachidicoccus sp. BS20]
MKQKKKSFLNRLNAWLHLWTGIVTGIILVAVCLSGTLVVYGDEVIDWSAGKAKYVTEVKNSRISVEQMIKNIKRELPNCKVSEVLVYKDPKRSVRFRSFSKEQGLSMIYVDPYSGKILKNDATGNFFFTMAHIHAAFLWQGPGEWIVDIATIIFLIEIITGIILWFPVKWNKHNIDASFKIKWRAKFKRVNYDLHNVLGFYSSVLAIILTVTGLLIAFNSVSQKTIQLFGGDWNPRWQQKVLPQSDTLKHSIPLAAVIDEQLNKTPDARVAQVWIYQLPTTGYYMITTAKNIGLKSAENAHISFVDRYTGKALPVPPKNLKGEYIENNIWQLHMGTWMGQAGKLFTFLCGLICTSLPITGFIIWLGKGRKKKKRKQPVMITAV